MKKGGIYIHVPFCRHKCFYCDFYTGGDRIADWSLYINCLIQEFISRKEEISFLPSTLYIGGGTPSLIPSMEFDKLIFQIKKNISINHLDEFTIEVNPEDVSLEKIKSWKDAGVNRISIGIQSLIDSELKAVGRFHNSVQALKALDLISQNFENFSVDVIFGLPNQTPESYLFSLNHLLPFSPSHISAYSLMLEESTALSLLVSQNKIFLPDEDKWLQMFKITNEILKNNGYKRYEISNYALPGKESLHNMSYWFGFPYTGLGPGAHSYDGDIIRKANHNDIKGYLRHFSEKINVYLEPFYTKEKLSANDLREEMIMTRLRTTDGLNLSEYSSVFGEEQKEILLKKAYFFLNKGLLVKDSNVLFLTQDGVLLYNSIVSELF